MKKSLSLLIFVIPAFLFSQSSSWKTTSFLDTPVYAHSAVAGDGLVFVAGGFSLRPKSCKSEIYTYNPLTKNWKKIAALRQARGFAGASYANGKLFLIGGNNYSRTLSSVEIYETSSGTLKYGSSMPEAKRGFAYASDGNKIYTFGGFNLETGRTLKSAYAYDSSSNTWERLPSLPFERQGASAVYIDGKIYIIGGLIGKAMGRRMPVFLKDVTVYDVESKTYSRGPSLVFERYYLSTVIHKGRIYAIGGMKGLTPLNVVETIDIKNQTSWGVEQGSFLPQQRMSHATVLLDGLIYVIGGLGYDGKLKTLRSVETLRIE
jgi:N-acetylneuraminic acid mutarotase